MRAAVILLIVGCCAVAWAGDPAAPKVSLGPFRDGESGVSKPGLTPVGTHRTINPRLLSKGKWNGKIWRLTIASPGARGIRLHLTDLNLAPGTKLTLRSSDGDAQTIEGRGPNRDGDLWTGLVAGDGVTLELRGGPKGPLPFRLHELSHLYKLPY